MTCCAMAADKKRSANATQAGDTKPAGDSQPVAMVVIIAIDALDHPDCLDDVGEHDCDANLGD